MKEQHADLEIARERTARFAKLPPRIHPDTVVETVETATPPGWPDAAGSEEQRHAIFGGH